MLKREDPEYMIGREYPIYQKGTLTFTKHLGKCSLGNELFEVVCSEDKELYPEPFKITRESFASNFIPCYCTPKPELNSRQLLLVAHRLKEASKADKKHGYDNTKAGNLYLTLWEGLGVKLLKIGITNRQPCKRIGQQKSRATQMTPTILEVYHNEDGKLIEDLEKTLLIHKRSVVSSSEQSEIKKIFPDGFTETFIYSEDNYNYLKDFFKNL